VQSVLRKEPCKSSTPGRSSGPLRPSYHGLLFCARMSLRTHRGKSPTPVISYPRGRKLLFHFLLLMSDLGQPVRIKFLPSLAFSVAHRRSTTNKSIKPPGRTVLGPRHPELGMVKRGALIRSAKLQRPAKPLHPGIAAAETEEDRIN